MPGLARVCMYCRKVVTKETAKKCCLDHSIVVDSSSIVVEDGLVVDCQESTAEERTCRKK